MTSLRSTHLHLPPQPALRPPQLPQPLPPVLRPKLQLSHHLLPPPKLLTQLRTALVLLGSPSQLLLPPLHTQLPATQVRQLTPWPTALLVWSLALFPRHQVASAPLSTTQAQLALPQLPNLPSQLSPTLVPTSWFQASPWLSLLSVLFFSDKQSIYFPPQV